MGLSTFQTNFGVAMPPAGGTEFGTTGFRSVKGTTPVAAQPPAVRCEGESKLLASTVQVLSSGNQPAFPGSARHWPGYG